MDKDPKQIVYRYNGVENSEEVEVDREGAIEIPERHGIITRNHKNWKAVHIFTEIGGEERLPLVRVFLTDQL